MFFDVENHFCSVVFDLRPLSPHQMKKRKQEAEQIVGYQEIWTRYGHYVQVQDVYIPFLSNIQSMDKIKLCCWKKRIDVRITRKFSIPRI